MTRSTVLEKPQFTSKEFNDWSVAAAEKAARPLANGRQYLSSDRETEPYRQAVPATYEELLNNVKMPGMAMSSVLQMIRKGDIKKWDFEIRESDTRKFVAREYRSIHASYGIELNPYLREMKFSAQIGGREIVAQFAPDPYMRGRSSDLDLGLIENPSRVLGSQRPAFHDEDYHFAVIDRQGFQKIAQHALARDAFHCLYSKYLAGFRES